MKDKYHIKTGSIEVFEKEGEYHQIVKMSILYSGMPNKETFALSPITLPFIGEPGKYCPVIYYPITKKEINVLEDKFAVIDVTPEEIILQYVK